MIIRKIEHKEVPLDNELMLSLNRAYYREYFGECNFQDESFLIVENGILRAKVLVYNIDGVLRFPLMESGASLTIYSSENYKIRKIAQCAINHLMSLNYKEILINDSIDVGMLSTLGEVLLCHNLHPNLIFKMPIHIDDQFSVDSYFSSIRKSYKSLVNWGRKNLRVSYWNNKNITLETIQIFKEFHAKTAGRKTRSDLTWELQYNMLQQGYGEIILGYLNEELIAGALFIDFENTTYYGVAVYERSLFEYGLSHYVVFLGICRAAERGRTSQFLLGTYDPNLTNTKERNIQMFKKGFCPQLSTQIVWSHSNQ